MGYQIIVDPDTGTHELDTFTCGHCQYIVDLHPLQHGKTIGLNSANGWCFSCDMPLCPNCANRLELYGCEIWEKQMEEIEARDRLYRAALGA